MSTFDGFVDEFPGIRVDYFRKLKEYPPLACFLSHVHSDHLAGLDTFDGSFIYCSAATREILLRLEKSAVRLNYAKGILENPQLQTYKHLAKKLRPIPLDTPTTIDLHPGLSIRVTLLDANHCVGAVMFLFEGQGKAVLYTGDIRCEPRFVTAISQNPNMVEYSSGWKTLDRIYLDTSILEDYPMQTKAQGLQELFEKLQPYPQDTIFHFQAWTYGYEEVWIALSKVLNSKIHVDDYKMRVFESLVTKPKDNRWAARTHLAKEAPALIGFTCGNNHHEGCLTRNENVRIHSCEKGMGCSVMENKPVVWIRPIVTHLKNGQDVTEVGVGGGGEDLTQTTTLTFRDILEIFQLISKNKNMSADIQKYTPMIMKVLESGRDMTIVDDVEDIDTDDIIPSIAKSLFHKLEALLNPIKQEDNKTITDIAPLPNIIQFPYARHSSRPELRDFVGVFKPKDVIPCTFDAQLWLEKGWTIEGLFGDCCSGDEYKYDEILKEKAQETTYMVKKEEEEEEAARQLQDSQQSTSNLDYSEVFVENISNRQASNPTNVQRKRDYDSTQDSLSLDSQVSGLSEHAYETRLKAYKIARANLAGESWQTLGLISTTDNHTCVEEELGNPLI
ncbi:hypothetical protein GGS20DRAFT_549191 [Poronia punctata]|nr:hypothetical protein GGS20DRAFT_549191 [Poronia punctata]